MTLNTYIGVFLSKTLASVIIWSPFVTLIKCIGGFLSKILISAIIMQHPFLF